MCQVHGCKWVYGCGDQGYLGATPVPMSDLHKRFLKRIRDLEQAMGLSLLAEEPNAAIPPPARTLAANDTAIVDHYKATIAATFPTIATHTDPKSGVSFQTYYRPPVLAKAPLFVLHHGAGSLAMTFAMLAAALQEVSGDEAPGVFVFDMRAHGDSLLAPDFSLSTLTDDFAFLMNTLISEHGPKNSLYLVGHSLGGAVLTHYLMREPVKHNVRGLAMIDIVEETAVRALVHMPQFISNRPVFFDTYQRAIDWHVKEVGLIYNEAAAALSIPALLHRHKNGRLGWKTDLRLTQPYWDTWFAGLLANFVGCGRHVAKLLVLLGHETLDTNLIIGQMQGKYQLIVFNNNSECGHFVQEDIPKHLAISLVDFVKRNDSPAEYMQKELGFVPKWGGKIHS